MHSDSCVRTLLLVWELVCLAVSEMSSQNEQQQQHPADHSSNNTETTRYLTLFSHPDVYHCLRGGGGVSPLQTGPWWGSAILGLKRGPKNLSESLKIRHEAYFLNRNLKILMLFKGLNLETVFLLVKKPLLAISSNYLNDTYVTSKCLHKNSTPEIWTLKIHPKSLSHFEKSKPKISILIKIYPKSLSLDQKSTFQKVVRPL